MDDLKVLPLNECDRYSQRCRLGPSLMSRFGLDLGNCIKLCHKNRCYFCVAWPREDCCEGYIQFHGLVTSINTSSNPSEEKTNFSTDQVKVYKHVAPFNTVHMDVILTDLDYTIKLNEWPNFKDESFSVKCQSLLQNLFVATNFKVDFTENALGKLYGISYIEINAAFPDYLEVGKILSSTVVVIRKVISKKRYDYCQNTVLCDSAVGGLGQPYKMLHDIISLPFKYQQQVASIGLELSKGVLLSGPPGTGKTSLVRAICIDCRAVLIHINGPELIGSRPGESEENLRKTFTEAVKLSKEGPTVLFLDEIDSLCQKEGRSGGEQGGRMLGQLLTLMDGLQSRGRLVVIGATNRAAAVDKSLRRSGRFDQEILIGIPSESQRREILTVHTRSFQLAKCVNLDVVADLTKGYVGADLACVCHEAAYNAMTRCKHWQKGEKTNEPVTMSDFTVALHKVTPSTQKGSDIYVDSKPVLWDQIGGLQSCKLKLKQAVEWPLQYPESFSRLGLPLPKGILLYGPPGCSKTMLVKAAATACRATFLSVSGAQLYSPFVGDSEKALTEAFNRARMGAPSILFLDEIDSIIGKRSESSRNCGVQERVLSVLLNEMDGVGIKVEEKTSTTSEGHQRLLERDSCSNAQQVELKEVDNSHVLVVAATNRPDMLDDALLRPGRFDKIIYVPPPDVLAREEIIRIHAKHIPQKDVQMRWLAGQTEGFTGADLENLCREASLHALSERGLDVELVTQKDFVTVLGHLQPSINPLEMEQYRKLH